MQVNGHTLTDVRIVTLANGKSIFLANLIGRSGNVRAGFVSGGIEEDGTIVNVLHINGSNQRRLA